MKIHLDLFTFRIEKTICSINKKRIKTMKFRIIQFVVFSCLCVATLQAAANIQECARDLFYRGYAFGYDAQRICQRFDTEVIECGIDLASGQYGFFGDVVLTCDRHSQAVIDCAKAEFKESSRRYSSFYDAVKFCEYQ